MIVNECGEAFFVPSKPKGFLERFFIGEKIIATEASAYYGLIGVIREARENKDTANETLDIYCDFYCPTEIKDVIALENRFSKLYGRLIRVGKIPLDRIIMAPGMIEHYGGNEGGLQR